MTHGRGPELPDEHTDHDGGKDNSHQERTEDMQRSPSAGRLVMHSYRLRFNPRLAHVTLRYSNSWFVSLRTDRRSRD